MNTLEIHSILTPADWQAYQAAWALRLQGQSRLSRRALLMTVLLAIVMAILMVGLSVYTQQAVPFLAVVIGAAAAILGVMMNMRRVRAAAQPDEHGIVLGPTRITFDETGMHIAKSHSDIRHAWSVLRDVTVTPSHLFVWVDRVAAVIVPVRDLPAGLAPQEAAGFIRALATSSQAAPGETSTAPAEIPADDGTRAARSPALHETPFLAAIGRFLTLRRARDPSLELSDRALLVLALFSIAATLVVTRFFADPGSEFYAYGFLGVGWYGLIAALTALAWARLSDPTVSMRVTLALVLAVTPIAIVAAAFTLQYAPPTAWLGCFILLACYVSGFGHMALQSLTARHQATAMIAGILLLSVAAWYAQNQYISPQFWYPAGEEESADLPEEAQDYMERWQRLEPLLFGQSLFIDESVAAMERPEDLPAAAFFVGFAGTGEERVFAGEIALASRVIANQFGTAPRTLQLVNDQRDLESLPFASASALRHALSAVAARMDLEQDVLILALSSHGSENGDLAVSNGGIPVNALNGDELASILAESGIRWRVIIVSACYSGTFIEPLRDESTIVITAAAADRASFGCSNERDLTYFGEAFYRDALPGASDLRTAFQHAKAAIARREDAEKIEEPSNPQAFFGGEIERQLKRISVQAP